MTSVHPQAWNYLEGVPLWFVAGGIAVASWVCAVLVLVLPETVGVGMGSPAEVVSTAFAARPVSDLPSAAASSLAASTPLVVGAPASTYGTMDAQ